MSGPDPDEVLRSNADLYEQKDEDYGSSWELAGQTMAMWAEQCGIDQIDPSNPQQMVSLGLYFQRLHKITRSYNLEFGSGDPNNEPIGESHRDESTYAGIHASYAERESQSSSTSDVEQDDQQALCIQCGNMKPAEHYAGTDHDFVGEEGDEDVDN